MISLSRNNVDLSANQNVIKMDHHKLANEWLPQDLIHEPYEGARGIGHPEWHHHPLVKSLIGLECGFRLIHGLNLDLMIPTL